MPIFHQRENPGLVFPGVNRVRAAQLILDGAKSPTDRGGTSTPRSGRIEHGGDAPPSLAGIPCGRGRGYRRHTTRYLRIPFGRGVTGAWHFQHSSVGEPEVPAPTAGGAVGTPSVPGGEEITR